MWNAKRNMLAPLVKGWAGLPNFPPESMTGVPILCYILQVKKFGFSLSEALHSELKQVALEEKTSMSAICREALAAHLERQKRFHSDDEADKIASSWQTLKAQVWNFLQTPQDQPDFFSEEYIPEIPGFGSTDDDLFGHLPLKSKPKARRIGVGGRRERDASIERARMKSLSGQRSAFDPTRFLDEIWA
jgi:hypothetical protein